MTNQKTARIIERLVNGDNVGRICREEGITQSTVSDIWTRYFYRPPFVPVEYIFESSMNDETVSNYAPNC